VLSIKKEAFSKLSAIRDLKVTQISDWLDERSGDMKTISNDFDIKSRTNNFINSRKEDRKSLGTQLRMEFQNFIRNYDAYSELFLIDTTGTVIVSTNKNTEGDDRSGDQYFTEAMKIKGLYIKDIYFSKVINNVAMAYSVPIYADKKKRTLLGVLVVRIDLENSLYDMLLDRTGMGATGETLIINQEVIALNELRWYENAPRKLKIKAKPAVMAAKGNTGIIESKDYRKIDVLAAYSYIPSTKWGFVSKQDQKEIYAPINDMIINLIIILLVIIIAVYFVSYFVANTFSKPLLRMDSVSQKIQEGDYSERIILKRDDELGSLANSFDNLTDKMLSQIEIQRTVSNILNKIVSINNLEELLKELLKLLVVRSKSNIGICYLLNEKSNSYEYFYSIGADSKLNQSFSKEFLEGEAGHAILEDEIIHNKDIPEDTLFKVKMFSGVYIPKEILTIPLNDQNKTNALISLASLKDYNSDVLEVIKRIKLSASTLMSNIITNQKTTKLAKELGFRNSELGAQATELQRQSEELHQQNIELDTQRRQVNEANRLKSEFLSNMSHELRTPLNSVMALSHVLKNRAANKLAEDELMYLEVIERNGKQLLGLINDILDLSKIEAGKMDLHPEKLNINTLVQDIIDSLTPITEAKNVDLNFNSDANLPTLETDERRAVQIIQNLCSNAVKFTAKGKIIVSLTSDAHKIHIKVSDSGIGIEKKNLPHIFEAFRQVDGSSSRSFEGTGLGLAIAYNSTKLLGGELRVESKFGTGTTFTLELPLKWEDSASISLPIQVLQENQEIKKNKTILLVDDDQEALDILKNFLNSENYKVVTATSGKEALEIAEQIIPFAIILDVIMPEMDGWEVLQKLKSRAKTVNIPVIISSIADDKKTGFALGAVGYITKPITKETILNEINRISTKIIEKILVVDDNSVDRKYIKEIIEECSTIEVCQAESGVECLKMVETNKPDLIVLDLMMPGMDGFQVLEKLRSTEATKDILVIINSAKDLSINEKKLLEKEAISVLVKGQYNSNQFFTSITQSLHNLNSFNFQTIEEDGEQTHILIVEDNEIATLQIKEILTENNYNIFCVKNGQEAINYLKHKTPDGIILDLMMPMVDGFGVLDYLRGEEETFNLPVLVLTAKDLTTEDFEKLGSKKIQQLVQKGNVDAQDLLFKIKLMLGSNSQIAIPKAVNRVIEPLAVSMQQAKHFEKKLNKDLPTVLVVEDNPDNMITIQAILSESYNIIEAYDGLAGLQKAISVKPDILLLDMNLPKMDGLKVVKEIRRQADLAYLPVLAVTAQAMMGDREEMLKAGCNDYISKPIDAETINMKIKHWLKR
jgi:CheY-like chemotaxis protein/signal transduction histidine kinase/HAMP domain-containing protein